MVIREWKGVVKRESANNYIKHLLQETFPQLSLVKGFIKARILKRTIADGEEFLVVTEWDSIASIKAFAGEDVEKAVVPKTASDMMVRYDQKATHFEMLHEFR